METKEKIRVVFRVYPDGDVLALFPYVEYSNRWDCMAYQHVGQHAGADYGLCVSCTKLATLEQYSPLLRELTSIYDDCELVVRRRR